MFLLVFLISPPKARHSFCLILRQFHLSRSSVHSSDFPQALLTGLGLAGMFCFQPGNKLLCFLPVTSACSKSSRLSHFQVGNIEAGLQNEEEKRKKLTSLEFHLKFCLSSLTYTCSYSIDYISWSKIAVRSFSLKPETSQNPKRLKIKMYSFLKAFLVLMKFV